MTIRRLLLAALFLLSPVIAKASCSLAPPIPNPSLGYQGIAGVSRYINMGFTGCPGGPVDHISLTSGLITITDAGGSLTNAVNGTIVWLTGPNFPIDLYEIAYIVVSHTATTAVLQNYNGSLVVHADVANTADAAGWQQISLTNWAFTGVGGMTGTLGCTVNCLPSVQFTWGNQSGDAQPTPTYPTPGPYTMTSPVHGTITVTSADDATKTATIPVYTSKTMNNFDVNGSYYHQVFQNQAFEVTFTNQGNLNQRATCTITSQPGGGDFTMDYPQHYENQRFHASVVGAYAWTCASDADPTQTVAMTMDVVAGSSSLTSDGTQSFPCNGTARFTNVLDVGPGQTYTTINSAPMNGAWLTNGGGNMLRIHVGTGSAPYAEYFEVAGNSTAAAPAVVCGVPDGSGNMPIITGNNAVGPSWYSGGGYLDGLGAIELHVFPGNCNALWPNHCAPNNLLIQGLKIINVSNNYNFNRVPSPLFPSGGVAPWDPGAAAIDGRNGTHVSVYGVKTDLAAQGVGTYATAQNSYAAITFAFDIGYNYFSRTGACNSSLSHPVYDQSFGSFVHHNIMSGPNVAGCPVGQSAGGSGFKVRGPNAVIAYNHVMDGYERLGDIIDNQDAGQYTEAEGFLGSSYGAGDPMPLNNVIANESWQWDKVLIVGNLLENPGGRAIDTIHCLADHDDGAGNISTASRLGQCNIVYNTINQARQVYGPDINNGSTPYVYPLAPSGYLANNIIWDTFNLALETVDAAWEKFQTNVFNNVAPGEVSLTLPATYGGTYNFGNIHGWNKAWNTGMMFLGSPFNFRLTLNGSDFIGSATAPWNSLTFIPNGVAVGSATTITDSNVSQFWIGSNAVVSTTVPTNRSSLVDIGAFAATGAPPIPPLIKFGGTIKLGGTSVKVQ